MVETKIELLKMLGDKENRGKLKSLGIKEIEGKLYCMYELNGIIFSIAL